MTKKQLLFFALLLIAFFSVNVSARILDIIIGGANSGLECKSDDECGTGSYCHQEQFYCVACDVPMYEWTGTECKCPSNRPVETEGNTCVECLNLTDCAGNEMFCNTNNNTCAQCKAPKEWINNACVCRSDSHAVGDSCECNKPNSDVMNFCACTLTPDSCKTTELNLNDCLCCPADKPVNVGSECKSCKEADPSKPIWKPEAKICVQCTTNWNCPANQYCSNNTCTNCPPNQERSTNEENCRCASWVPHWNGSQCVQCTQNDQCGGNNICVNNTCKPFTCQEAGFASSGLRIVEFDPARDMSGNPHLWGIWDSSSVMGSSRKDCDYGRILAEGHLYAARAGTYQFRVMGGDWGKSSVNLWMDNGQLVFSGQNQNPGIASIYLSEGPHSFTYDGWIECRRNILFQYDSTYVKACTNR